MTSSNSRPRVARHSGRFGTHSRPRHSGHERARKPLQRGCVATRTGAAIAWEPSEKQRSRSRTFESRERQRESKLEAAEHSTTRAAVPSCAGRAFAGASNRHRARRSLRPPVRAAPRNALPRDAHPRRQRADAHRAQAVRRPGTSGARRRSSASLRTPVRRRTARRRRGPGPAASGLGAWRSGTKSPYPQLDRMMAPPESCQAIATAIGRLVEGTIPLLSEPRKKVP